MSRLLLLVPAALLAATLAAQEAPVIDLVDYRTVEQAHTVPDVKAKAKAALPGYLGIHVVAAEGRLAIDVVQPGSPAEKAGIRAGDILGRLDGKGIKNAEALREQLQAHGPGQTIMLGIERAQKAHEINVTLAATSRPLSADAARKALGVELGVKVGLPGTGDGVKIEEITPNSAAAAAGLKVNDVLLTIDGKAVPEASRFREALVEHKPGDIIRLALEREGKTMEVRATLTAAKVFGPKGGGGPPGPDVLPLWKKDVYRLAVVLIEFPDIKQQEKISSKHWEEALFSRGSYRTTATGQPAFGSLNDYFLEQSYGKFHLEGKFFAPVLVKKKRAEYAPGNGTGNRTELLNEVLDKLSTRDGKDALKNFDGLCFLYAGSRIQTNRGSLYFPHRGSVFHQGKRWPYMLAPEGGSKMETISVLAPECAKLLGLPELFARPENPGSEGLGVWCLMSNGAGEKGRPGHLSAWCKEQLGWLEPAVIHPAEKQKLLLSSVQKSPRECYKVLVREDGSEYLLLENRTAHGFDGDIPGQGLLIWRIAGGQPTLEEAHGVTGPTGPRMYPDAVPYPSKHNNAFTPLTTPSSRSPSGGGLPVYLTNIRRLPDGRIALLVGYDYY